MRARLRDLVPRRGVHLVGVALGLTLALSSPSYASDPPGCPGTPGAYEGNDPVVSELRALRVEAVQACVVAEDRAAQARTSAHTDALAVVDDLDAIRSLGSDADHPMHTLSPASDPATPPGADDSHPAHVQLTAAQASAVSDGGSALHGDLWFLVGLLAGLPAAFYLLREVAPWRS